jgi:hypothetical protein
MEEVCSNSLGYEWGVLRKGSSVLGFQPVRLEGHNRCSTPNLQIFMISRGFTRHQCLWSLQKLEDINPSGILSLGSVSNPQDSFQEELEEQMILKMQTKNKINQYLVNVELKDQIIFY